MHHEAANSLGGVPTRNDRHPMGTSHRQQTTSTTTHNDAIG